MAASRPLVNVYGNEDSTASSTVALPGVFKTPIRPDIINFVHTNMAKNHRQPYAVSKKAGHQTSAESWGTGRAVARIPRVRGGGTHRSGQAAFGNMCRGGRMFAPTKVWRRWHRKINTKQRRYAVASALAASALPALVMARGHRIEKIPEVPLVVSNGLENIDKTKSAMKLLQQLNAVADVERSKLSRKIRAGKGKMRNRRHVQRKGPLVIYNEDNGIRKAFRNIPGVDTCSVDCLNLLELAPGGHVGRFCIWSEGAFKKLDAVFGTTKKKSIQKKNYMLPRSKVFTDIQRVINSDEVQKVLRAKLRKPKRAAIKKNPLKNPFVMHRLNPYATVTKRAALKKHGL
ncbi:large ribosomal subunit protein uL4B-like [Corticium candelabrum]|uniref:large ribosomal subunit protein uL4B-like n=1 Tax=Corticium candelabrum TaxID=121492 RepID=UPI002E264BB1|nr:large ribosomal subunit protein uL4B-like [Corticium candelabrum]